MAVPTFAQPDFPGYGLLDSGGARKLERFGELVLDRPDPQALWRRRLDPGEWRAADLRFERESDRGGRWVDGRGRGSGLPEEWELAFGEARLIVRPTPFKHVGVFPEQAANWEFVRHAADQLGSGGDGPRLLNLFGYTGAASILAAQAGYRVTHVDASKTSLAWMRANLRASGMAEDSLRTVLEDAVAFVRRELRRGSRYEGILLDPPHYGRGPKGQKWQYETGIGPLLEACGELLGERAFLVLSTYAIGSSPLAFENMLAELVASPGDGDTVRVDARELALSEEPREGLAARLLPCGFCARLVRGMPGGAGP